MVTRRLVAILCADVAGFSSLCERDETGTHVRLLELLTHVLEPGIAKHGGRVVKRTGDGLLAEFASATEAVRCAVGIQRVVDGRQASVADEDRIAFRIGINLGDIIVEGDDIFGDGVNVAARLEGLAEPGGICVSAAVRDQVREDLGVQFEDSGEQQLKNITKPVHVFRISLDCSSARRRWRVPRRAVVVSAGVALLAGALVWVWSAGFLRASRVPELRSVLIVPFHAEGTDPALAAVAHLTPEVTRTVADGLHGVRVVPANAAAAHAGRTRDATALGREANVRFVVETDLRASGSQPSVTARIFDTIDSRQVDSYRMTIAPARLADTTAMVRQLNWLIRSLVADAVATNVVALGEAKAATAQDLVDLAAGIGAPNPAERGREQRRLADAAIKLDPNFGPAWMLRATGAIELFFNDFTVDASALPAEADADSLRAVTLDGGNGLAWVVRANALRMRGNTEGAFAALDRAQDADPALLMTTIVRGWTYLDAGKPRETLAIVEELRDLGFRSIPGMQACWAHLADGAYARAIEECERVEVGWNPYSRHAALAAAYALHGDLAMAAREKERLLAIAPAFTIASYEARWRGLGSPASKQMYKTHLIAGLRKAGLPQ